MHGVNFEHIPGEGFRLTDFPHAEKIIGLRGKSAQELADMALHLADLSDAEEYLELSATAKAGSQTQRALWKMAIITFTKCFGRNNARANSLDITVVLPNDELGQTVFRYFKSLRDKNIAHDDNPIAQCHVGAIINKPTASNKVEKVVTMTMHGETYGEADAGNLMNLIRAARSYAGQRYDQIANELTLELEARTHPDLVSAEGLTYRVPVADEVHVTRGKLKS